MSTLEQPGVPLLNGNDSILSPEEAVLVHHLIKEGQSHLFRNWPRPGEEDEGKKKLVAQLSSLNDKVPGGLIDYIKRAKKLLADSRDGVNPYDGFTPCIPTGLKLDYGSEEYQKLENIGILEAAKSAFVLVAGGLGERLGYSGIKIALPTESVTGRSFMQLYAETILACQNRQQTTSGSNCRIPLVLMTSDDTHNKTVEYLQDNNYFGLLQNQVTILKQEKVPCISDNDGRLSLAKKYVIETKPHGHGDVHALLHSSGLARKWHQEGIRWICFFQDTNSLVFRGLIPSLGVSSLNEYDMNFLTIPRKAKEAIGGITQLNHDSDGLRMTVSVEYNQLEPLLHATVCPEGDVNDGSGFSPYPGNINQIVLKVKSYVEQLEKTKGIIGEFVNPKYKDHTRTDFKSSARLECMMQDYAKSLPSTSLVSFTLINQVWSTYSPVKNSVATAVEKVSQGVPPHAAASGEADLYQSFCRTLSLLGAHIGDPMNRVFGGLTLPFFPCVVWSPNFAVTIGDLRARLNFDRINIATGSVLVLDGNIEIDDLDLDGALLMTSASDLLKVQDLKVKNSGWELVSVEAGEDVSEETAMRGFKVIKHETKTLLSP